MMKILWTAGELNVWLVDAPSAAHEFTKRRGITLTALVYSFLDFSLDSSKSVNSCCRFHLLVLAFVVEKTSLTFSQNLPKCRKLSLVQ